MKLTEKQLTKIVTESVYRALQENMEDEKMNWKGAMAGAMLGASALGGMSSCTPNNDADHEAEIEAAERFYNANPDQKWDSKDYADWDSLMHESKLSKVIRENIKKIL